MGCDIHLHVEVKVDGRWEHWSHPNVSRDYALFERMAGVRGDPGNAIVPPRGLPPDVSVLTRRDADDWEGDAHTHSWLGPDDVEKLSDWLRQPNAYRKGLSLEYDVLRCSIPGGMEDWRKYPEDRCEWIEDFRLVFWFDN